jgi:hypothetical protein
VSEWTGKVLYVAWSQWRHLQCLIDDRPDFASSISSYHMTRCTNGTDGLVGMCGEASACYLPQPSIPTEGC